MKLYISERFLTFKDKAAVTDENGAVRYYIHGDFAIAKKYYVDDVNGTQLASVVQKKNPDLQTVFSNSIITP